MPGGIADPGPEADGQRIFPAADEAAADESGMLQHHGSVEPLGRNSDMDTCIQRQRTR